MSSITNAALGLGLAVLAIVPSAQSAGNAIVRSDHRVELASGEKLYIREVAQLVPSLGKSAVLLLHGARVPGVASFDLAVPGGSLAADLAGAGHRVYILDLRGYGGSSRFEAMSSPPDASAPLMRTPDAVSDIGAAVDAITNLSGDEKVSILGWATGGHWAGAYAAVNPQRVERLVLHNTLYGGSSKHVTLGRGTPLENPERPGKFNAVEFGGYRLNTRDSLFGAWDDSIRAEDKATWRDPAVASAYADAALASDATSGDRQPPSFRAPSGAMADSFELAIGRKQWSAANLTMPVLAIRSERDFWSRPEDAQAIVSEAPDVDFLAIPDATHFVHLDRDSAGRRTFVTAVTQFLAGSKH